MDILFYDYETRWSRKEGHSVGKQNPVEYVMDSRTEVQVLTFAWNNDPVGVIIGENMIGNWFGLNEKRIANSMMVAHNGNGFDHMITQWRFGIKPMMWGDTLCMGKPLFGKTAGGSLKALAEELKVGKKGSLEATNTEGLYVKEWTSAQRESVKDYAKIDTELCRAIFKKMLPHTPIHEMKLIDLTARMAVDPGFEVDTKLLESALVEERARKQDALRSIANILEIDDLEIMQKALMSNAQFSDLLNRLGVETPRKISITTGKETYALAKTDAAFLALQEHENPMVAAAADARLGAKSTILESRLETFLTMANFAGGKMPVGLNYWGASTGRWSGGFKANQQNLPRVDPKEPKPSDALRRSLRAPAGHKVVVADLSGIELRVNHFLWKVEESINLYMDDPEADLYKAFASKLYHIPVEDVTKPQRQFAKMCQLGLGYGMFHHKFRITAQQEGVNLSTEEAAKAVQTWRDVYKDIVEGWNQCEQALSKIHYGIEGNIDPWGLCQTGQDIVHTPGSCLRFPLLRNKLDPESKKKFWVYGKDQHIRKIYGSHMDENIVQHLARNIIAGQMLQIAEVYPIHLTVHDEIVCVVPERQAKDCLYDMLNTMKTAPKWWPEIVLWAEGDIGDTYADCK